MCMCVYGVRVIHSFILDGKARPVAIAFDVERILCMIVL